MIMGLVKLGLDLMAPGRSWASKLSQTAKSWWMETGCWSHWASRLAGWLAPSAKERRRSRTGLIITTFEGGL